MVQSSGISTSAIAANLQGLKVVNPVQQAKDELKSLLMSKQSTSTLQRAHLHKSLLQDKTV
ncbi:MAG: hypothetical protein QM537_05590 [Candidatus Symbiobacter sp.]|nr:hypothetical protein [Candidatus Symbiobacter sp.]